jgi:hypothetical protein
MARRDFAGKRATNRKSGAAHFMREVTFDARKITFDCGKRYLGGRTPLRVQWCATRHMGDRSYRTHR